MTIELTREQEVLIQKLLATGRFSSKDDVMGEALRLLERQGEVQGFRDALRDSQERNRDLGEEAAAELADEAVRWARAHMPGGAEGLGVPSTFFEPLPNEILKAFE